MQEAKHEIIGTCSKCAGVVMRVDGTVRCSACGSMPEIKMEKTEFIREDFRGDSTRLLRNPRPGGEQLNG